MESVESLKARIKELEDELAKRGKDGEVVRRQKIDQMSSEVVDSNPYRYMGSFTAVYVLH